MKRALSLLVLILAFGLLGATHLADAATVWVVDDDGAQCPSAGFTTIADAITAASPGDTIVVCPGSYAATTITKRLTLSGFTGELSNLKKCADSTNFPADSTTKNSIVAGFTVGADHVTIKGFTLTAPNDGVLVPGGINAAWVTKNVAQGNSVGVNLNGTMSVVDHNCLRNNSAGGPASGTGIYSDQGLKSADIVNNVFFQNTSAAITLLDAGAGTLDDVRVKNNVSSGDGDLISIAGSTHSQIKGNTATGTFPGSGIYIQAGTAAPNSTLEITNNTLTLGNDEGIYVADDALTSSTIKSNRATNNKTSGLHIEPGTGDNDGNTITSNNFRSNQNVTGFDCWDETSGSGTAGTANTWSKDKGKTQSPNGICKSS
jgi:nitrous oxidase accessory protein NosD